MVSTTPDVPQGVVAGKYRLSRLLGRGGMGSVWEGVHTTLGTRVAVKFIDAEYAESPEARSRFENEARAAATLRSKYVVEVYDHGVMADGRPFIVMEFLEGEPLDKRLDRFGRLPPKDTARILHQVCRALAKAHAANIVHRDLKPENVFLVWDDEDGADIAKVVDFGIAKFTDAALGPSSATRTGSVLGTPYYMSPEQARGLRSVDHRSDIWSLGVIAYRCIVGTLPFDGEAIGDLLVKLCTAPVPVPSQLAPDVPPGFDAFIHRALAREPSERFQTVKEFSDSLLSVCGLSMRGPYGSGAEIGMPNSALASGPHPAATQAVSQGHVHARFGLTPSTGAPITQTPTPHSIPRRSSGALVGGAIAAAVVLAIGIGVAAKFASNGVEEPAASTTALTATAPEPPAAAAPAVPPPTTPAVTVAPAPPAQSAPAVEPSAAPVVARPNPVRPSAGARPVRPTPRLEPVKVEPPKVEPPKAAEPPKPPPPRPGKTPIDVGY